MKIANYNDMMAYLTQPDIDILPRPKPQELLDLQEQNRKDRLRETMETLDPVLMDESKEFIERENFQSGTRGVVKGLGNGLYEVTYKGGSKAYYTKIYDRETGKEIKKFFGSDKEAALKSLKEQKAEMEKVKTKFDKIKEVKETKGEKEFKKITDKIDKKFNKVKDKGYTNLREFRKEMQELVTKDKFSNVFETKAKLGNYMTDKFIDIEDVNTSKMESALDKYKKVGGKERGTITKIASEFGVNKQTLEGNIQKTGRTTIPIKYGSEYDKRKAVSEKRKKAEIKYSDPSFESKMSGSKAVQKSHMDDLYSKIVTAQTLGYAPEEINQVLLKDVDAYMNALYKKRNKLLKNKPAGYKEAIEEINQKGIAVAQATDGYKSFQIEQPDGKKYQFGVEPGKTIDPTGITEGKQVKGGVEKVQFKPQTVVTEQLEGPNKGKITKEEFGAKKPTATLTPDPVDQYFFEKNREAVMKSQSQVSKTKMKNIAKQLSNLGFKCAAAEGGACDNPMAYLDSIKEQEMLVKAKAPGAEKAAKAVRAGKAIFREVLGPAALGFELAAAVPITFLGYKAGLPPQRILADATYGLLGQTEKRRVLDEAVKAGIDTTDIKRMQDFYDKAEKFKSTAIMEDTQMSPDDAMQYPDQYAKAEEDFFETVGKFEGDEERFLKAQSDLADIQQNIAQQNIKAAQERADFLKQGMFNFSEIDDALAYMANGGRIGFADGPEDPSKRTFLKIMGGLASLPFVGKFFKGAKTAKVVKLANTTTTMPDWFPAFVDKALAQGVKKKVDADLTEVEIPDLPGVKMEVSDAGPIRVEGVNAYDEPYVIEYTPPGYTVVDERTGQAVPTPGDFKASDTQYYRTGNPEEMDYDVDFTSVKDVEDILGGNSTELEGFAKGTKETKLTRGQKRVDEADSRLDVDEGPDIDLSDYED